MKSVPEELMGDIAWRFSKVVNGDRNDFFQSIVKYNLDIDNPINETEFTQELPISKIIVQYEYAVEEDSDWVEEMDTIEIIADKGKLSCLEMLHKIHIQAHANLKDLDHCYFEGLEYTEENSDDGTPIYEVILGS